MKIDWFWVLVFTLLGAWGLFVFAASPKENWVNGLIAIPCVVVVFLELFVFPKRRSQ